MKEVTVSEVGLFCPSYFNYPLMKTKHLLDKNDCPTDMYLTLQSFYKLLLEKYFDSIFHIRNYDDLLKISDLNFSEVKEEEKDIYQRISNFHYFYIRNTIYLEKLTIAQINHLIAKFNVQDYNLDEKTIHLIEDTYSLVLENDTKEETYINYGPSQTSFFASSKALILGVRYDQYFHSGESDEEWFSNHLKRLEFLQSMISKQIQEMTGKIPIPIQIIIYDDYSVKRNLDQTVLKNL